MTIEELEKKLKDKNNIEMVRKAYNYALNEHKGMKRLTGDDFITHPLEVANILADLNVDNTTIIAALLHETENNGNATYEDIASNFNEEIAKIVDSISKINKLELPVENESSASYLRKILIGMSEDVRVLYIKLADKLHNMRTNWAVSPSKQKDKAKETMDVLIPIAHRLGINGIKSELENLCLFYLKPDVYNDILDHLNADLDELNESLETMKENISDLLSENNMKFEIKGRVKSVYGIYNKLNNGKKWEEIYDILALRVLVDNDSDCYTAVGIIHSKYRPLAKRFKDYIATPKENMYQSLHTTIFGDDGKLYEVQIRTYEMDEIDEKGLASHWSYKEKGAKKIQNVMEQKLELYRNIIDANSTSIDNEFENVIRNDILNDSIYCYTPKGDVVELPKGSTPIDFAYRIHSNVGDKAVGAIVNDVIVPFSYELEDGDIINIKTSNMASPNKDWLNIVKTSQAKNKIKAYFSKKDKEEYILKGKNILEKELRKRKLTIGDVLDSEHLKKILTLLKLKDEDDLYLSIGSFRYTVGYLLNIINDDQSDVEDPLLNKRKYISKKSNQNDIIVSGIDHVLINLAKCCKPIKGDDIIGFITKGEGITIHKKNCPNIDINNERIINVDWNYKSNNLYQATCYIYAKSDDILKELIEISTKKNIKVISFKKLDYDDSFIYELVFEIKDREDFDKAINLFSKIKHVMEIRKELK